MFALKSNSQAIILLCHIFVFSLVTGTTLASSGQFPDSSKQISSVFARDDCQTSPAWQASQAAWALDDTDKNAASWWSNVSSTASHSSFANELGKDFGGHLNSFECGINDYATCTAPPCSDYIDSSPAWSYQLILSTVNLNTFFNNLYVGIGNGQTDYLGLVNEMAEIFFPWKTPAFILGDAEFWIVAVVTALLAIPATAVDDPELAAAVGAGLTGVGAFVGAGVQQVTYTLTPDPNTPDMYISQGEAEFDKSATTFGQSTRDQIAQWANATFLGQKDSLNQTVLDYVYNGSFSNNNNLPTASQVETFWKAQMVSRRINVQWNTQTVYIMFSQTKNPNDTSGPEETRYYSEADGGVYYLYMYQDTGVLRGQLTKPWGLDNLSDSSYGIPGSDITKASARAFRVAGFNYTQDIANHRILKSLTSNGTLTPFQDGAGWEGTWTLPVCDTGAHNWQSQYNFSANKYGMLPCCCGPNCNETAAFIQAANMNGSQTLLRGCKAQLQGSGVDFNQVDYGFAWDSSWKLKWASFSKGQKAGVGIGLFFAAIAALIVLASCCIFLSAT